MGSMSSDESAPTYTVHRCSGNFYCGYLSHAGIFQYYSFDKLEIDIYSTIDGICQTIIWMAHKSCPGFDKTKFSGFMTCSASLELLFYIKQSQSGLFFHLEEKSMQCSLLQLNAIKNLKNLLTHVENRDIISKLSRESTANENNNLKINKKVVDKRF